MFKKYRKKPVVPVVIEAAKWENNMPDIVEPYYGGQFIPLSTVEKICDWCGNRMDKHGIIPTEEGCYIVCPGDYIIKDKGKYYPCKPDRFKMMYEEE